MTLRLAYRLVEGDRAILELLLHREENGEEEGDNRRPIYTYFETFGSGNRRRSDGVQQVSMGKPPQGSPCG